MSDGARSEKPRAQPQPKPAPNVEQRGSARSAGGGLGRLFEERRDVADKAVYRFTDGQQGTPPLPTLQSDRTAPIREAATRIMRKANGGGAAGANVPNGGGAPLPGALRTKLEPKLGADLSSVRIHTGGESAAAASQYGARAFTVGNDVHFNAGEFNPGTKEGDRLLGHELTHVVQGQNTGIQRKAKEDDGAGAEAKGAGEHEVSQPHEPAEQEADAMGDHVAEELHGGKKDDKKDGPQGGKDKPAKKGDDKKDKKDKNKEKEKEKDKKKDAAAGDKPEGDAADKGDGEKSERKDVAEKASPKIAAKLQGGARKPLALPPVMRKAGGSTPAAAPAANGAPAAGQPGEEKVVWEPAVPEPKSDIQQMIDDIELAWERDGNKGSPFPNKPGESAAAPAGGTAPAPTGGAPPAGGGATPAAGGATPAAGGAAAAAAPKTPPPGGGPPPNPAGIAAQVSEGRFIAAAQQLEKDWGTKNATDRATTLGDAAANELQAAQVYRTQTVLKPLGGGTAGQLNFQSWSLDIDKVPFDKPKVAKPEMAKMANTVYHEARHAEQWFQIARLLAGQGKTPDQITAQTLIPKPVTTDAALPGKQIKSGSPQQASATAFYDSIYGANKQKRNTILKSMKPLNDKLKKAKEDYEKSRDSAVDKLTRKIFKSAVAKLQQKLTDYVDAANTTKKNYQDYRNLVEEADAWKVGDEIEAKYNKP